MFKLDLEKSLEQEIKLPTSIGSLQKQESSRKTSAFDYTKAFGIMTNWKILKEMGILDHLACLRRNLYVGQEATVRTEHGTIDWFQIGKQQLELDMEQQTGSKLGKEYIKAVYCHPVYLAYIQNTSYEMLGWMKHKLELRLLGEISITSDMQMTQSSWQKVKKN